MPPFNLFKEQKFSSLRRENELFENWKVNKGRNRSKFRKTVFTNRSQIFIALLKFYATHRNYEILSTCWSLLYNLAIADLSGTSPSGLSVVKSNKKWLTHCNGEIIPLERTNIFTTIVIFIFFTFGYVNSGRSVIKASISSFLRLPEETKTSTVTCDWREMEWTCRRAPCSRRPGRNPAPAHTIIFVTKESMF